MQFTTVGHPEFAINTLLCFLHDDFVYQEISFLFETPKQHIKK